MPARGTIRIDGVGDLQQAIRDLKKALSPKEAERVLLAGARVISKEMRTRAHKGPTGNLKAAMKAKIGKHRGEDMADAFAAVDRKKAPHAHFLEFGTTNAPAYPFMRPAIISTREQVAGVVTKGLKEGVDAVVKRRRPKGGK